MCIQRKDGKVHVHPCLTTLGYLAGYHYIMTPCIVVKEFSCQYDNYMNKNKFKQDLVAMFSGNYLPGVNQKYL